MTAPPGLRERNKQRRAAEILGAVRTLLREDGGLPSVDRIAERAEVAPATVFNLIGTREHIWAALAYETLTAANARVAQLPPKPPLQHVHAILEAMLDVLLADAIVSRAIIAHWNESGRLMMGGPTKPIADTLRAAGFPDASTLAVLISTTCLGATHQWSAGLIDDAELRTRCAQTVDLVFRPRA